MESITIYHSADSFGRSEVDVMSQFVHTNSCRGHRPASDDLQTIDGAGISSKAELLAALADTLGFPDYFGKNWDAFDEMLREVAVASQHNVVLEITHSDNIRRLIPDELRTLVEIWSDVASDVDSRRPPGPHLVLA